MQVIGFSFKKISAEKFQPFKKANVGNNIDFVNIEKEHIDVLKEAEAAKISFTYSLIYEDPEKKENKLAELTFQGTIVLSITKEESKEISKAWKKKQLPPPVRIALFNVILRKCTPKAIYLQDEIALPPHIPMPRLTLKQN